MGAVQRIPIYTYSIGQHRITVLDCFQCGEVFGVLDATDELRRRSGQPFYCPNGHANIYTGQKSVEQRQLEEARRQLVAEHYRATQAEQEVERHRRLRDFAERSARGSAIATGKAKAAARRLRARVEHGVCPDCHRSFKQLAAHMKTKHGK